MEQAKKDKLASYTNALMAKGKYWFTHDEAKVEFGLPEASLAVFLSRGRKKRLIASPYKNFYVCLPPEYQKDGCLPADEFIPHLMNFLKEDYYAAYLSAAQYHGASHHKPQAFQVVCKTSHRKIKLGSVNVIFYKNKYVKKTHIEIKNTRRSMLKISTAESTALDLVANPKNAGGFNNLCMVLSELAEVIKVRKLVQAFKIYNSIQLGQRTGYLFDELGFSKLSEAIFRALDKEKMRKIYLLNSVLKKEFSFSNKWKVIKNIEIEEIDI